MTIIKVLVLKGFEKYGASYKKGEIVDIAKDTAESYISEGLAKKATKADEKKAKKVLLKKSLSHPVPPISTLLHPTPLNSTQDDNSRNLKIKSILSKERPKIEQLKCGIHKNIFYYGTIVYNENKPLPAIITSDKQIYVSWGSHSEEIKDKFGLNYRYAFEFEVLDGHWSNEGIKSFLYDNTDPEPLHHLYLEIKGNNQDYMWYPDEIAHKIVALDILSSYFLPVFQAIGRTFIEAEKGSGKTRQCTLYKLQAFNSVMSADISKSAFYRIMESTCGTLIIDDFDSINEEQKNDVLQHYKTGYKNTSKTVRTGEGRTRKSDAFRNYGHVIMNNTSGLDDISRERTKPPLPILKTDKTITKKNIKETDKSWQQLRDRLFTAGLNYWKDVKEAYEKADSHLSGRDFEITRPILALASLIDEELKQGDQLKQEIETWLMERFEDIKAVDPENDWGFLALQAFRDKTDGATTLLKDIACMIADRTLDHDRKDYKSKVHGITIFLGKTYRKLPGIFKIIIINGQNHARLTSKAQLEDYLSTKGWSRVESGEVGTLQTHWEKIDNYLSTTPDADVQTLLDLFPATDQENVEKLLEDKKNAGDIFEHKPGRIKKL